VLVRGLIAGCNMADHAGSLVETASNSDARLRLRIRECPLHFAGEQEIHAQSLRQLCYCAPQRNLIVRARGVTYTLHRSTISIRRQAGPRHRGARAGWTGGAARIAATRRSATER
jgi:hypothetical protein